MSYLADIQDINIGWFTDADVLQNESRLTKTSRAFSGSCQEPFLRACRELFIGLVESLFCGLAESLFCGLVESLFCGLVDGLFCGLVESLFCGLGVWGCVCFSCVCRGHGDIILLDLGGDDGGEVCGGVCVSMAEDARVDVLEKRVAVNERGAVEVVARDNAADGVCADFHDALAVVLRDTLDG